MAKFTRRCYACKTEKELDDFPSHKGKPLDKGYRCKPCCVEAIQQQDRTVTQRRAQMKCKYGISLEQWDEMYEKQGGGCLICTDEEDLVVDHNHDTGEVRGLLCRKCNSGLGMFKDNDLLITAAARYLRG